MGAWGALGRAAVSYTKQRFALGVIKNSLRSILVLLGLSWLSLAGYMSLEVVWGDKLAALGVGLSFVLLLVVHEGAVRWYIRRGNKYSS